MSPIPVAAAPIESLRNLGPATAAMLREIGVDDAEALRALGPVEAWRRLRFAHGRRVTAVALYALAAGLDGRDWRKLAPTERTALRRAAGI